MHYKFLSFGATEDRIRNLCGELSAEQDPEKINQLAIALRAELHNYIEELRSKMSAFPLKSPFDK